MKKWTEKTAKEAIKRNGGSIGHLQIRIQNPGLRILGAMGYLINYHRFVWVKDE